MYKELVLFQRCLLFSLFFFCASGRLQTLFVVLRDDYNVQPRRQVSGANALPRSTVSEVAAGISRLGTAKHRLDDDDASSQISSASKTRRGYYTVNLKLLFNLVISLFRFLSLSHMSLAMAILMGMLSVGATLSFLNKMPTISLFIFSNGSLSPIPITF